MAMRNSTRRKARKPKLINVEGHLLTPAMYARYELCLKARISPNREAGEMLRLGLDDFLAHHRPSHKIKGHLSEICHTTTRLGLAVGAMDNYTFYAYGPASIRSAGCKLLKELALELYNASAKLTAIAMGVEAEETTKLQDWLARAEEIAQIGRGAEVTRG